MINNFNEIEKFIEFKKGSFYKFECIIRNTDGDNPLYRQDSSNTNKNILIKSWWVDSQEYYDKVKHEMIELCNMTGARLYMTLDRKSLIKLLRETITGMITSITDFSLLNNELPSAKKICKLLNSKSSVLETSDKTSKTIMFDIDDKNKDLLELCTTFIGRKGQTPFVLETKKGWHVFCYKKFDTSSIMHEITTWANAYNCYIHNNDIYNYISCNSNQLGLVYHPERKFEVQYNDYNG